MPRAISLERFKPGRDRTVCHSRADGFCAAVVRTSGWQSTEAASCSFALFSSWSFSQRARRTQ